MRRQHKLPRLILEPPLRAAAPPPQILEHRLRLHVLAVAPVLELLEAQLAAELHQLARERAAHVEAGEQRALRAGQVGERHAEFACGRRRGREERAEFYA